MYRLSKCLFFQSWLNVTQIYVNVFLYNSFCKREGYVLKQNAKSVIPFDGGNKSSWQVFMETVSEPIRPSIYGLANTKFFWVDFENQLQKCSKNVLRICQFSKNPSKSTFWPIFGYILVIWGLQVWAEFVQNMDCQSSPLIRDLSQGNSDDFWNHRWP